MRFVLLLINHQQAEGVGMSSIIEKIKERVAIKNGFNMKMPTCWNYAMLITHRTKQQLKLYDEVIEDLMEVQQ